MNSSEDVVPHLHAKARYINLGSHAQAAIIPAGLILISLLALGLRVSCLDCHSYWGDETASLDGAALGWPDLITGRFGWVANQTPLHYAFIWLMSLVTDPVQSEAWVRLPQAIAGALTPLAVYLLGKETLGKWVGFTAAILTTLSALHINHSQEVRLYALMTLFSTLSLYTLIKAGRTHKRIWWAAFVLSSSLNVLNAYVALVIFMPALAPFLLWLLAKLWRARHAAPAEFRRAVLAVSALALVCILVYLDMSAVPRPAPNPFQLSPLTPITTTIELLSWISRSGLDGNGERIVQMAFLLAAVSGAVAAYKNNEHRAHLALFLLCLFIPATLLALFGTTNVVFQRYALFALPIYFLLVANGACALMANRSWRGVRLGRMVAPVLGLLLLALTVGSQAASSFLYHSPDGHQRLAYRPDFRGVAGYLTQHAASDDVIVFLDDPGLGYTITAFYLQERFPSPAYDARDPRLYRVKARNIFWVISAENLLVLEELAAQHPTAARVSTTRPPTADHQPPALTEVAQFSRVIVLRESQPGDIIDATARLMEQLEVLPFGSQPIQTMKGTILQARGDITGAAAAYRLAGSYFPVGADYLRTAEGFDARNDEHKAWREAAISKFWEPGKADIHYFYARKLSEAGYFRESEIETQVAQALETR